MSYYKSAVIILAIIFQTGPCIAQEADFIFKNAKIYRATESQPIVQAMAIKADTIIYIGNDSGTWDLIGPGTMVYDMEGKLILPGIHDVHQHPLEASSSVGGNCQLDPFDGINGLINALQNCNLQPNSNGWITGFGHSILSLLELNQPSKSYLDNLFPNTPVAILEETSHSVWVNSKALEMANITLATPDPVGGHIYKFPGTGEVDGILFDNAGELIYHLALASTPEIDELNYNGLVSFGLPLLARNGITSICEARTYYKRQYIKIWKKIKDNDLLTCRVILAPWIYPEDSNDSIIAALTELYDEGDDFLRVTQAKCYSDGLIQNATAAFHEPYEDNLGLPFNTGLNYIEVNRLAELVMALEPVGIDFHIHAIGDRGVSEGLDAVESAQAINGDLGRRHRITHLEVVRESDYPRFNELGVIADMQVVGFWTHPIEWPYNEQYIGEERSDAIIPLRDLHDYGAMITLSSDWDVASVNPFTGMQNALTRSPQALPDVATVVDAYTINGAYLMQQEDQTGSLEVGKWADFICVDRDIFSIPTNQISQTKVLSTWLAGEEIYNNMDFVTGIDKQLTDESDYKVLLSPSHPYFTIEIFDTAITSFEIYTMEGQHFKTLNALGKDRLLVKTSSLPAGTYIITGMTRHQIGTSRKVSTSR